MRPSRFPAVVTWLVILFFYVPIAVLVATSFNASKYGSGWMGFSLKWYVKLFHDREIWEALANTLVIGAVATLASMALGTCAAFALHRYAGSKLQKLHYGVIYLPLVLPEILTGLSLLLLYVALNIELNLATMIVTHTTFCLSYVAMTVLARLQDFDFSIIEAAQDLGAGWTTTVVKVLLPMLAPGILAGGLLAFTLSLDDFVISFFVAGPDTTTLPIKIYSMVKFGAPPMINALSSIMLLVTFAGVAISQWLSHRSPGAGGR